MDPYTLKFHVWPMEEPTPWWELTVHLCRNDLTKASFPFGRFDTLDKALEAKHIMTLAYSAVTQLAMPELL